LIKENDGKTDRFANQLDEDEKRCNYLLNVDRTKSSTVWKLRNSEKDWKTTHVKGIKEKIVKSFIYICFSPYLYVCMFFACYH